MTQIRTRTLVGALALTFLFLGRSLARPEEEGSKVKCGNLVYAVNKTSVCFSDRFLRRLELETNILTDTKFARVELASDALYNYPFVIMTGEGGFTLTAKERI